MSLPLHSATSSSKPPVREPLSISALSLPLTNFLGGFFFLQIYKWQRRYPLFVLQKKLSGEGRRSSQKAYLSILRTKWRNTRSTKRNSNLSVVLLLLRYLKCLPGLGLRSLIHCFMLQAIDSRNKFKIRQSQYSSTIASEWKYILRLLTDSRGPWASLKDLDGSVNLSNLQLKCSFADCFVLFRTDLLETGQHRN